MELLGRTAENWNQMNRSESFRHLETITQSPSFIKGFRHLIFSQWWSRLWTLQEVVLAFQVTLCFGSYILSWESLSLLCYQLMCLGLTTSILDSDGPRDNPGGFTATWDIKQLRDLDTEQTYRQLLLFLPPQNLSQSTRPCPCDHWSLEPRGTKQCDSWGGEGPGASLSVINSCLPRGSAGH